jgi:ABC-2 type transport system permease protein
MTANRFAAGTFTPAPQAASLPRMLAAQTRMELTLLLRNGEQLMLTMFIPITMLIGLSLLPLSTPAGDTTAARATTFVPAVLAVAITATAFTGQAIAVGFDRRYGALKRLGATAIPRWGIIAGKSFAVVAVVAMQAAILGLLAAAFGWRPSVAGLAYGVLAIAVGTVALSTFGLLLGGTLKAEVVLALANVIWFVLLGMAGIVVYHENVPAGVLAVARATPSGALAEALSRAAENSFDATGIGVLVVWAVVGGFLAIRWFKFE